ncbi:MAG: T9SS type A sorting domain-containing protein [Saprospiraceae bacterium]
MKNLLFFFAFLSAGPAAAQCPYFAVCPTTAQLLCDYSINDTLYWHSAPYTWNPSLMLSDLPETEIEVGIVARDSCWGQDISVEYTLFLDLDGNDTAETVIKNNMALLPGKVLYNNILSPNYALGDTIEFDHRTGLQDSMKYRFGLELTHFADSVVAKLKWTTGIENLNYSNPILPIGKHRILWRIEQGGVERFCEYGMDVKDCAPPVVSCVAQLTVNLIAPGIAILSDFEMVQSASDNLTPSEKLIFSIRAPWFFPGNEFPTHHNGNPIPSVLLLCDFAYNTFPFELWVKDLSGNTESCISYIKITDSLGICPILEPSDISVCTQTELQDWVENVRYLLEATPDFSPPFSRIDSSGLDCGAFHTLFPNLDITLTPSKNDNPLNGVTTYDLVLMSKHILAIESLNSPYKMIAADVNKSGSVTTFDILEIRKLILGFYTYLPNNTSWRFVDKSFVFPNAQNPFQTAFQETAVFQDWPGNPSGFNFIGIKVGDANGTAIPNATSPPPVESRASSFLVLPDLELKTGESYEIPLRATEIGNWLGLQFSLDFDPKWIDIEAVESSILSDFDQNNWALSQAGRLTLSWSSALPVAISSNEALIRLRLKARADIPLSKVFKTPENPRFRSEAYDINGVARDLDIVFSEKNLTETLQIFAPQPNPTTASAILPIQLSQAENIRLEIRDLAGKLLWVNKLSLEKGSHTLEIPASAMLQAGVYVWRIQSSEFWDAGKVTKI